MGEGMSVKPLSLGGWSLARQRACGFWLRDTKKGGRHWDEYFLSFFICFFICFLYVFLYVFYMFFLHTVEATSGQEKGGGVLPHPEGGV